MIRKIQKKVYFFLSKNKIFYPALFYILKRKGFLDKRVDKKIRDHMKTNKHFFFVQIGANDGRKADPIYLYVRKYKWEGLLVEPVRYIFEKLKENYKFSKNLIFENVAIGGKNGFKKFYRLRKVDREDAPLWYDEIGSFSKEHVMKHKERFPELEKYLISEKVRCLTPKNLLDKHKIKKIDFLQIDAEGYDYNILKDIPFNKVKPKMILYEDRHLSEEKKNLSRELLIKNGYKLLQLPGECFAMLKK